MGKKKQLPVSNGSLAKGDNRKAVIRSLHLKKFSHDRFSNYAGPLGVTC